MFSQAVRSAAASYLSLVAAAIPLSNFWAIRLTSGGDGEMLYPGGGTYWAFDQAALTGNGLAAGMTPNPDPSWKPGTAGLTQAQISTWVNWYIGGLDNVTNWQMQTLSKLGFTGYYETVTPGSGTRPGCPDPDRAAEPVQRRHHRRRRGLEPVLRHAPEQDQRHRLHLLRRRQLRRQRPLPGLRRLSCP